MIIFLYGPDTYRSREKLDELRKKFQKDVDPSGDSIKVLDGEKLSLQEFSAASASSSLFAKRRMVVIKNIFSNKNKEIFSELSHYLISNEGNSEIADQSDNVIVFIDDNMGDNNQKNILRQFLLKQRLVQVFSEMSNTGVIQWIIDRAKEDGMIVSRESALKITGLFGNDLWVISSELKKLLNYKKGQSKNLPESEKNIIGEKDFEILSKGKISENIFAFTDAIGNKEKNSAIRFMEIEIEAGVKEAQLLNMVINQFRILIQLRQAIDRGYSQKDISSGLKMHPYVMQKSMRQAKNFSLEFLKSMFKKLMLLDKDMKSGKADFKISLELLIAESI